MPLGGLGLKLVNAKQGKPLRDCERCGLKYPEGDEACPHCADLEEGELAALISQVAEQHEAHGHLGRLFFVFAIISVLLLVAANL